MGRRRAPARGPCHLGRGKAWGFDAMRLPRAVASVKRNVPSAPVVATLEPAHRPRAAKGEGPPPAPPQRVTVV
jgi:hypothetical protein